MKAADQATGRLPGDTCDRDWIWDREVETEDHARALARGEAAWEQQWRHLMESSAFYRRRFGAAGIGPDLVRLADISRLPFTSKADLKEAIDELRQAADRVQGKKEHSGRNAALLLTGIALGILFNPVTGPQTRKWLTDAMFGSSDEFTYEGGNGSSS